MNSWHPDELKSYLDDGKSVFLKLWKKGCGACTLSKPALEKIEAKDTFGLLFGQISVDDYPEMLEITDSEVLPFFFVFKNKKLQDKKPGFKGQANLEDFIRTAMSAS